jgi:4-amino-4-deoxy-L-arabinose transferase-like glycosyltransferase
MGRSYGPSWTHLRSPGYKPPRSSTLGGEVGTKTARKRVDPPAGQDPPAHELELEGGGNHGSVPLIGGALRQWRFTVALTAITAGALLLRVWYVLAYTRYQNRTLYDSFWYYYTTLGLHLGEFFRGPFSFSPTAAHPPMTTLLLAAGTFVIGLHGGTTAPLLVMAVLGSAVVACVGLLGRSVAGPWVGLTAAVLAALAPNFWMPSGIMMSETPAMLFMVLILLAVVHLLRSPTVPAAVLLGLACGGEALTRAELILFVPGLLVPATLIARTSLGRRFLLLGAALAAATLVLAPWVGRNLVTFTDPTYISSGNGLVLLGANCPQTYGGSDIGLWSVQCAESAKGRGDESVQSSRAQHAAVQFMEHHADRVPIVMLVRIAREWDLYNPVQMAHVETGEGRPVIASLAGLGFYYFLLPCAVAGSVILRRRRIAQWFLLVPAAVVTLTSALFFALVRFRAPFEVCLVVLAAPAIVLLLQRLGRHGPSHSLAG